MKMKTSRRLHGHAVVLRCQRKMRWNAVVARAVGRSHKALQKPCEDAVGKQANSRLAVIALADGAGSAKHASKGADIAVAATINFLRRHFHRLVQGGYAIRHVEMLTYVRKAIAKAAVNHGVSIREFASTLLFAASDGIHLLIGQVGDGRVGVRSVHTGQWISAIEPSRGEYANETCFITTQGSGMRLSIVVLPSADFDACALMSDGAEASLFDRRQQSFAKAMDTLAAWVKRYPETEVEQALARELEEALTRKTFDDVSIALLVDAGVALRSNVS